GTSFVTTQWLAGSVNGVNTSSSTDPLHEYVGDFNGDGRTDYFYNASSNWYVALSTGSGFAPPTQWLPGTVYGAATSNNSPPRREYVGDFNGDGRADYLDNNGGRKVRPSDRSASVVPTQWLPNSVNGVNTYNSESPRHEYLGDFNGDGRTDYL